MERELWERQAGESRQAFAAFCLYRDMGPERSTAKVAHQLGKSKTLMDRWSRRWRWVERADAWDAHQDRLCRMAQEQARVEMAKRHAEAAMGFLAKVAERLKTIRPEELSTHDMAKWLDVAVKVERLARGESTENVREVGLPPMVEVILTDEVGGEGLPDASDETED